MYAQTIALVPKNTESDQREHTQKRPRKNGRNGKGGKATTQVSRSFSFSSLETQSQ
jgi:hypothetical protein